MEQKMRFFGNFASMEAKRQMDFTGDNFIVKKKKYKYKPE
jgi:hypothetical protein